MEANIPHVTGARGVRRPEFAPARYAMPDEVQRFLDSRDRSMAQGLPGTTAPDPQRQVPVACTVCGRPAAGPDDGTTNGCACGLTPPERAAIHLLQREFPSFPLGTTAVIGGSRVVAAMATITLEAVIAPADAADASGPAVDSLFVTDFPVCEDRRAWLDAWLTRIRPGGGLILALGPEARPERCLPYMEQCRRAGFVDVALFDPWSPPLGYTGDGLLCIAARRSHAPVPRLRAVSSRADISVVIPLYNHQQYIEAALESVFGQSSPPAEVIVIDDGSSDRSADIASRLCAGYPGAVFWRQPNRGAHNAINAGLMRATRPVLAILNSDDVYHSRRLERCLATLGRDDADLVASKIHFINENGAQIQNEWYETAVGYWRRVTNTSLALLNGNFLMTTSNVVMRRRVLEKTGFFQNFRYAHDLDFFIRALSYGHRLAFLEESLLDYRYHPRNTIQESQTKVRAEWAFICACVMRHCPAPLLETMDRWEYFEVLNRIVNNHGLSPGVLFILELMCHNDRTETDFTLLANRSDLLERVYRGLA